MPTDKIIRMLASEQGVEVDALQASIEKENAFLELLHLLEPIPSVVEVARKFQGKLPMVVASGGFSRCDSQADHSDRLRWLVLRSRYGRGHSATQAISRCLFSKRRGVPAQSLADAWSMKIPILGSKPRGRLAWTILTCAVFHTPKRIAV